MPQIATHWQIDRLTYRFRIDPNARWSDGQPVVADDVVATWTLMMDKGLQDPSAQLVFEKFDKPVAESSYIVRVTSRQLNWRNFLISPECPCIPHMFSRTGWCSIPQGIQLQDASRQRPLHRQ